MSASALNGQSKKHPGCKIVNNILIGKRVPFVWQHPGELILEKLKSRSDTIGQVDAFTGMETTFAEMCDKSVRCAVWLKKQGVGPSDVIAISTHNHLDVYAPVFASLYVGAAMEPWDTLLNAAYVNHHYPVTEPKVIFATESVARTIFRTLKHENKAASVKIVTFEDATEFTSLREVLESAKPAEVTDFRCAKMNDPDQTALLLHTSGTTGTPKVVQISYSRVLLFVNYDELDFPHGQPTLWSTPLIWISCSTLMYHAVISGSKRVVCPDIKVDTMLQLVEKYKVAWVFISMHMINQLSITEAATWYDVSSLKTIVAVGSIISKETILNIGKRYPHSRILQSYGMTEMGSVTYQQKSAKVGSVGNVLSNIKLKMIDTKTGEVLGANQVGEIYIASEYMMTGYLKNPQATKEAFDSEGFLRSGDLGYYDDDGDVYITDRIKEVLKYKGQQLSPTQIEKLLITHPAVFEAVVVGVPHPDDGSLPMAFVSKVPGQEVTEAELINLVAENMTNASHLRAGVKFMSELPRPHRGRSPGRN